MSVQRKHIGTDGTVLIPIFADKFELLDYLGENKELIFAEKMSCFKTADAFGLRSTGTNTYSSKVLTVNPESTNELKVKAIINATNLLDTHKDVHIPGLWKKGLQENPPRFHLQEHKMSFENEISRDFKAYTETVSFKSLGYPRYKGDAEVLVFDSNVRKSVNEYMFRKYAMGMVDNHSVGMQYIKMLFAVNSNSSEWKQEKDNWDKYYPMVANVKDADQSGYFWPILEAKAIEGSAVLGGSCWTTPTMSVEAIKDNEQPNGTQDKNDEQPNGTRNKTKSILIY